MGVDFLLFFQGKLFVFFFIFSVIILCLLSVCLNA